jgi:hypothetical protein
LPPPDVVAGLVLTTVLVPVGTAHAVASGVPAIYGPYAMIAPLLAYAVFPEVTMNLNLLKKIALHWRCGGLRSAPC